MGLSCYLAFGALLLAAQDAGKAPAPSLTADTAQLRIFEAAATQASTLISQSIAIIAGSILAILGTSYYRPRPRLARCGYLLFIPAWVYLARSINAGVEVQSVYLMALFQKNPRIEQLLGALNHAAAPQIDYLKSGLMFLGAWLVLYLFWWIFNKEEVTPK